MESLCPSVHSSGHSWYPGVVHVIVIAATDSLHVATQKEMLFLDVTRLF